MNENLLNKAGFKEEVALVKQSVCPFCKSEINMTDFTDALSIREYKISGLCQKCQNEMFGWLG